MLQKFPYYNWLTVEHDEMPEFSDCCCKCGVVPFPVCFGSDLAFSLIIDGEFYNIDSDIYFCTPDGAKIKIANVNFNDISTYAQITNDLSQIFVKGDCFRLRVQDASEEYYHYSPLFIYIGCEENETKLFEFWDADNEDKHYKIRLWSRLSNPQPKTDKTEYADANGFNYTLAKSRRKEYELTFDFYPESMHNSIQEMLIYPYLLVDDEPMYESGDYDIDWENADENGYAKAGTKLSEQEIIRYGICE